MLLLDKWQLLLCIYYLAQFIMEKNDSLILTYK